MFSFNSMYMYMYIVPLFVFVSRYLSPFFFCFLNDSNHAYAYPLCARNHPWIDYIKPCEYIVEFYLQLIYWNEILRFDLFILYDSIYLSSESELFEQCETMLRRFQLYWTVYSLMSSDKWNSLYVYIRLKILEEKIEVKLITINFSIINLEYL